MRSTKPPLDPIFIVGARRSGTTLLKTMLSRHPNLLVHPDEPQFLLGLYQRFGLTSLNKQAALNYVRNHPYIAANITDSDLERLFLSKDKFSLKEFAHDYIDAWGNQLLTEQTPVLKHPLLIYHLDLITELFPNASIIHIIRDPRANVSSQRARWPEFSVLECAKWWRDALQSGRQFSQQYPQQMIEIKYEDLTTDADSTLRTLCQALNIPYSSQMLEFELETSSYSLGEQAQTVRHTGIDMSRLERWKKYLSPEDVKIIEFYCRHEMEWCQYPLENPEVGYSIAPHLLKVIFHSTYHMSLHRIKNAGRQAAWRLGFGY